MEINIAQVSTEKVQWNQWDQKDIEVSMLRLDRIHPLISGNKWFKLRYYLEDALRLGKKNIITFGGAWSSHILATAAACKMHDLGCTGIIRGEEPGNYSSTLRQAASLGMKFVFSSRASYRDKQIPDIGIHDYLVPEGGYGLLGAAGAATILDYCNKKNYTHICCAAGTGTMLAGIATEAEAGTTVIGISVLKNNSDLEKQIDALLPASNHNYQVFHEFHNGGYAKYNPGLLTFMNRYFSATNIPTDFVYTGKLCYAVNELILRDHFPKGSNILLIHSGGLQGNDSLEKGTLIF